MLEKIKKLTDIALTAGFLGFIYLILVMTYTGPVQKAVEDTRFTFGSYEKLSGEFEKILQKNLYKKYGFINLNGRIARILRINTLNGVNKLSNGFLTWQGTVKDVSKIAENVIELNKFLLKRNIPHIYILAPAKNTMYDVHPAPGYVYEAYKNADNMIDALEIGGVTTIDMNAWFKENGWHMKDVFFKTDHHWAPKAGLAAARCTMELLQQKGIAEYDENKLQDKSYKVKILKNWFLGSQGKRVGKDYAGVDNLPVYFPKFKTNYSYMGLHRNTTNWGYTRSLLAEEYLKDRNYFEKDPHCLYLYGDLPLQIINNPSARNKKKVLIIGDSFRRVWQYFMATQFKEIHSFELRHYTDGSLAQYVEEFKPDIVIMCANAGGFTETYYTFGVKNYLETLEKPLGPIQDFGNIDIQAEEKNNNKFEVVCSNLEPNQTYTLTIDSTKLSGVKDSFIQMTLQNISEDKAVYNRYFNANSGKTQKWIFTTPENGGDTYGIYLYAGTKGHTAKIAVKVEGIKLQKGINED